MVVTRNVKYFDVNCRIIGLNNLNLPIGILAKDDIFHFDDDGCLDILKHFAMSK